MENNPAKIERVAVTVKDVCSMLGIGNTTTYNLIAEGKLETIKIGRATRVTVASINKLVANAQLVKRAA